MYISIYAFITHFSFCTRFISILRALHFVNNETVPQTNQDRFIKLGSFMTDLLMNFQRAIHAGKVLCIDESLIPFKGRLSFKQYNPKKRSRFGVKLFLVVDSAMQFVLDVLPYQGKSTQITDRSWISLVGFGGAAVLTLLQPYLDAGRRIIIDNWFHSLKLARMLKDRLTYVLGTVQKRRKGIPRGARMTRKLRKGEVETFSDGDVLIERLVKYFYLLFFFKNLEPLCTYKMAGQAGSAYPQHFHAPWNDGMALHQPQQPTNEARYSFTLQQDHGWGGQCRQNDKTQPKSPQVIQVV